MPAKFLILVVCLGIFSTLMLGCGSSGDPVVVPPDVATKVKTEPAPEKTKAGKPNMNRLRND